MEYFIRFVPLIAIFAVMYFLMIRPQKKANAKKGSNVGQFTSGSRGCHD